MRIKEGIFIMPTGPYAYETWVFHNADGSVGSMHSNFNILITDPYTYKNKVWTDCARIIILLGRIYGC